MSVDTPSESTLVEQLLARCTFPDPSADVVCAVSGGADSLALLALAVAADLSVTAVHVDHGLRPESAAEAQVVAAAAERFGVRFRAEQVDVPPGSDLENRARQARHYALGPDAMTGHTADDQAETLLINLLRGAGISGLAAMKPGFRHPILALRRTETVALCAELGLEPINDPSNDDPRFIRNRIRHEALPLLADIADRDLVPLMTQTADHARQASIDLEGLADGIDPTDCRQLRTVPLSLAQFALRNWLMTDDGYAPSTAELARLMAVVNNDAVACEISLGRRVERSGQVLRLVPNDDL